MRRRCATRRQCLDAARLDAWARAAERGEAVIYANGRARRGVMEMARRLHAAGLVTLVQRREPEGGLAYIAQRTWKGRTGAIAEARANRGGR